MIKNKNEAEDYDKAFAKILWRMLQVYKDESNLDLKKEINSSIADVLKKWSNRPHNMISQKVKIEMKKRKIPVEPWNLKWSSKYCYNLDDTGKKNGRWIVFEHTTPINIFIKEDLLMCKSENQTLEKLKTYSGICLITKEEDKRLAGLGFRFKRGNDWQLCYKKAGIVIVNKNSATIY